jgi:DnaJ-class molecular chaperone
MGVRARATGPENWKQCPRCSGTGHCGDDDCSFCLGLGWLRGQPAEPVETQS